MKISSSPWNMAKVSQNEAMSTGFNNNLGGLKNEIEMLLHNLENLRKDSMMMVDIQMELDNSITNLKYALNKVADGMLRENEGGI